MDFSALMGGQGGNDVNADFGGLTAQGKPLFSSPFGDVTSWRTKSGGLISVSFLFNPKQPYAQDALLASSIDDPVEALKEELRKHLLTAAQISPEASKEEVIWQHLRTVIPGDSLLKSLMERSPAVFDDYVAQLRARAASEYDEIKAFSQALETKEYSFAIRIAVDGYPQIKKKKRSKSPSVAERPAPCGVLTLHIEHVAKGSVPEVAISMPSNTEEPAAPSSAVAKPPTGRKRAGSSLSVEDDDDGPEPSGVTGSFATPQAIEDRIQHAVVVAHKMMPDDAAEFFDAVKAWYDAVLKKHTQELDQPDEQPSLYR